MAAALLDRKIGLAGAVFLLVGNVVGASIFILPGQLAGLAGPAVFIAYLIALAPALVNCMIAAQVGSIMPVSAGDYVYTSLALHPFFGFIGVWAGMLGLILGVPILAYGFADYMAYFLPDVPRIALAVGVVLFVLAVNLLGLRSSVRVQMAMVSFFVLTLLVFGIGGLFFIDWSLLTPIAPNGYGSVLSAAVPAFYSYSGFLTIVILGEEIRNPERNIPWTVFLSFLVVVTIYTLVTLVLPGLIPWQQLGSIVAPMGTASALFLPDWFSAVITVAALLAAATSINVALLKTSRSLFGLSRGRIWPLFFAQLSTRTREPAVALVFVAFLALLGIAMQGEIIQYAAVTVIGTMIYGLVWALALVRLPQVLGDRDLGGIRFSPATLWTVAGLKMLFSILFLYVGMRDNMGPALLYLALLGCGGIYFLWRRRYLEREGISLDALLQRDAWVRQS